MLVAKEEVHTLGELADILQEPPSRVDYIIRKLRIKPVARVGTFRLFANCQIEAIKNGLYNIQIRG